MQIKCPKCQTVTYAEGVNLPFTQFGCPACRSLLDYTVNAEGAVKHVFKDRIEEATLTLGMKGRIGEVEYTITAVVVKMVQSHYYWREYILTAAEQEQLYLSETDGHWILLSKIDDDFHFKNYPEEYNYEGLSLKLYDYDDPKTILANGFFDYNVRSSNQRMVEYINPPYIYSVEIIDGSRTVYFGEHIGPTEVKKAFNLQSVPSRQGIGIVQPFAIKLSEMAIIFCVTTLLIALTHLFIYYNKESTPVLNKALLFSKFNNQSYVSPSFTLEGGSAPMTIRVHSDVNNSWAAVQVSLVNEHTNSEETAVKDIEYYHGYTDGENWKEGSTTEIFNICGVGAGKYHLVVSAEKAPDDMTNDRIEMLVEWDQPTAWNMSIPILVMAALFVITYFVRSNFNQRRWADSSYSPYKKHS